MQHENQKSVVVVVVVDDVFVLYFYLFSVRRNDNAPVYVYLILSESTQMKPNIVSESMVSSNGCIRVKILIGIHTHLIQVAIRNRKREKEKKEIVSEHICVWDSR